MCKILNAAGALFITGGLSAQITIHSSDLPNAGDSVLTSVTNSTAGNNQSLAGAGYAWDYSALTPNLQRFEKFDSPLTFPSVYSILFNIFTTTYGRDNYTLTSLPVPGVSLDAAYDFYKKSSSDLRQTGSGYVISGTPLPFVYTAPDVQLRFPLNFGNFDSCNYKFGLPIPSIGYYGETGHRENTVDGWGMLTTPYGSFSTLRVKSELTTVDTIYIDAVSFGTRLPATLTRQYKWYATGMKVPVLEVDAVAVGSSETVTNVMYIDSTRAGVPQVGVSENSNDAHLSVFPNPASDAASVSYHLSKSGHVHISVSDILGKEKAVILDENQAAGDNAAMIDAKQMNLAGGIYFIVFEANGTREVKKLVIAQ